MQLFDIGAVFCSAGQPALAGDWMMYALQPVRPAASAPVGLLLGPKRLSLLIHRKFLWLVFFLVPPSGDL